MQYRPSDYKKARRETTGFSMEHADGRSAPALPGLAALLFALGCLLFRGGLQRLLLGFFFGILGLGHGDVGWWWLIRTGKRGGARPSARRCDYFFLSAAAFALVACCDVTSACFLLFETLAFACFCEACFCVDFGERSPMVGVYV